MAHETNSIHSSTDVNTSPSPPKKDLFRTRQKRNCLPSRNGRRTDRRSHELCQLSTFVGKSAPLFMRGN